MNKMATNMVRSVPLELDIMLKLSFSLHNLNKKGYKVTDFSTHKILVDGSSLPVFIEFEKGSQNTLKSLKKVFKEIL